jgi:hypothetical protein
MMQYHTPSASLHQDPMRKLLFELQSQGQDEVDSPFPGLLQALQHFPSESFIEVFTPGKDFWTDIVTNNAQGHSSECRLKDFATRFRLSVMHPISNRW